MTSARCIAFGWFAIIITVHQTAFRNRAQHCRNNWPFGKRLQRRPVQQSSLAVRCWPQWTHHQCSLPSIAIVAPNCTDSVRTRRKCHCIRLRTADATATVADVAADRRYRLVAERRSVQNCDREVFVDFAVLLELVQSQSSMAVSVLPEPPNRLSQLKANAVPVPNLPCPE